MPYYYWVGSPECVNLMDTHTCMRRITYMCTHSRAHTHVHANICKHKHTWRMRVWLWRTYKVWCQYFVTALFKVGKITTQRLVDLWVENEFHNKPQWFSTHSTNPKTIANHLVAIVLQKKQSTDMLSVLLKFMKTRWKGMWSINEPWSGIVNEERCCG